MNEELHKEYKLLIAKCYNEINALEVGKVKSMNLEALNSFRRSISDILEGLLGIVEEDNSRNAIDKFCDILGVKVNVPFLIEGYGDREFTIDPSSKPLLYSVEPNHFPEHTLIDLLKGELKIVNLPAPGNKVFFPNPYVADGFTEDVWDPNSKEYFIRISKNLGLYTIKEEAIEKAKELGWIKG